MCDTRRRDGAYGIRVHRRPFWLRGSSDFDFCVEDLSFGLRILRRIDEMPANGRAGSKTVYFRSVARQPVIMQLRICTLRCYKLTEVRAKNLDCEFYVAEGAEYESTGEGSEREEWFMAIRRAEGAMTFVSDCGGANDMRWTD